MAYFREEVTDLVNSRFLHAEEYADGAIADSATFLDLLSSAIAEYTPTFINLNYDLPPIPVNDYSPALPEMPTITFTAPVRAVPPTLLDVTVPSVIIPSLTAIPPVITFPDPPADIDVTDPGDMPVVSTEFDIPAKPTYSFPTVPTLAEIIIPEAPSVNLPVFDLSAPVIDLQDPISTFAYDEQEYQSTLASAIEARLLALLNAGGTGLGADAEAAIWDRARNRAESEREKLHDETLNYFAARGWTVPPAVLAARLKEVDIESDRQLLDLNRDITVEQAKLTYEHSKQIVQIISSYEEMSRGYATQVANRALEAAKINQQVAIDIFNAAVAKHNLELDTYKTAASVFEVRMRASFLELEKFKVQLEGAKLTADVQESYIRIYNAQLAGLQVMADLYKTEMQSVAIKADVERIKLETYREKVNAYGARISAKTVEYNAYQARIGGELAKAQVFDAQVRANATIMEGSKIQADINLAQANAIIQRNNGLITQYTAEVDAYKAEVQAEYSRLQSIIGMYGLQLQGFDSSIKLASTKIDADIKSYDAQMTHETNRINVMLKNAEINLSAATDAHKLQIEALKAGANVSAQLAASAMSSVSAAAQLSFDGGHRYSDSDSNSTQHIYTHSE